MFKVIENKDGTYQSVFPRSSEQWGEKHKTVDEAVAHIKKHHPDAKIETNLKSIKVIL